MKSSRHANAPRSAEQIEKAAGDWLARSDRGFTKNEASEFAAWEKSDPRHAAEFARLTSAWSTLDTADEVPRIMALSRKVELALERRAARRRHAPWFVGAAAAAAVALGLLTPREPAPGSEPTLVASTCRVIPSAARQFALPDGSRVDLNADTVLEPAFTPGERRVRLVSGEAHFAVAKDPNRPFVVEVGRVALRAVGTAFIVRVGPAAVQLLVTEGKVRVDSVVEPGTSTSPAPLVTAGQRLVVEAAELPSALAQLQPEIVTPEELQRSVAWKQAHLEFERTPLAEAVAAFNRFNTHQLVIDGPQLASRKLGGTFQANNVEAFVHLLENGFDVVADRQTEGRTILRVRR